MDDEKDFAMRMKETKACTLFGAMGMIILEVIRKLLVAPIFAKRSKNLKIVYYLKFKTKQNLMATEVVAFEVKNGYIELELTHTSPISHHTSHVACDFGKLDFYYTEHGQ